MDEIYYTCRTYLHDLGDHGLDILGIDLWVNGEFVDIVDSSYRKDTNKLNQWKIDYNIEVPNA